MARSLGFGSRSFGGRGGFSMRGELSLGRKLARMNWLLAALLLASACVGFVMLYSVAGGSLQPWAEKQLVRFAFAFGGMFLVALIDIRFWRALAAPLYVVALVLLVLVALIGDAGGGAQRWLVIGGLRIQPSELMKVALVLMLARYYHWLNPEKVSRPFWVVVPILIALAPAALIVQQPDLGTALLLLAGAAVVIFLAGVSWWYIGTAAVSLAILVALVILSRETDWQLLNDYQYRRIDAFLDPTVDPSRGGYHIRQSLIAIGSGGWTGKGLMQGWQTHQAFLPEPHTDFIFATLAEELGFQGAIALLSLYMAIVAVIVIAASRTQALFGRLLTAGVGATFFVLFFINMAMVMGITPVVGVPLPLVSFGGTSMLVLLFGFGVMMSAQIHDDDEDGR